MLEGVNDEKLKNVLERIASALERIVGILEGEEATRNTIEFHGVEIPEEKQNKSNIPQIDGFLQDFLSQRGIEVKGYQLVDHDPKLDKLAVFMGDRFENLKDFLKSLRKHSQFGEEFVLSLKNYPSSSISDVCQLCANMKLLGYIEDYSYLKAPKYYLTVKTTRNPSVQSFLDGKWLQRYVWRVLERAKNKVTQFLGVRLNMASVSNLKVSIDGMETELYHLFRVNEEVFLIEAKLGEVRKEDIEKYIRITKTLQLGSNMILILAEPERFKNFSNVHGVNFVRLSYLDEYLVNKFTNIATKSV